MFLRFDPSGRPILPFPRQCERRSEHRPGTNDALLCRECNPCFCPAGAPGSLYECTSCVRHCLGGAKRARELGIANGFCDHNIWKRGYCKHCKKPKQASGARAARASTAEGGEDALTMLARVADAQPRMVKRDPASD